MPGSAPSLTRWPMSGLAPRPLRWAVDPKGKSTYRSYLVATPETAQKLGISTPLEGEAGMKVIAEKLEKFPQEFTFTFTDTASTSGHAIPRYFMWKVGLDPDKVFKKVGFSGTHDAAELMVKNKAVDMCADNDMTNPAMVAEGKIFARDQHHYLEVSPHSRFARGLSRRLAGGAPRRL